jgi:small GTP-binding protein
LIKRFIENSNESGGPTLGAAEFKRQIYLNNSG